MSIERLTAKTLEALRAGELARVAWVQRDHWQATPTSNVVHQWMEYFYRSERNPSPPCMQVIATGGGGKSAMMSRYAALHAVEQVPDEPSRLKRGVLLADCLDAGEGPKGLAKSICRAAWPKTDYFGSFSDPDFALETLRRQQTRLLILDEAAEVLVGGPKVHERVINFVKKINTELCINIVTATVHGLDAAFQKDRQMSSRFAKKFLIPDWSVAEPANLQDFLFGYERFLPFEMPSELHVEAKRKALLKASSGNMRSLIGVVRLAALWAISDGASCITLDHIRQAAREDSEPPPIGLRVPLGA